MGRLRARRRPVPQLFVTQTPLANALTVGAQRPMVIIFSGLARDYSSSEVDSVLAHEMGHVLSEHYYYQTALQFLSMIVMSSSSRPALWPASPESDLPGPARVVPGCRAIFGPASALVVGDPLITCQMLMRIAGGALEGMSLDAFLAQAARYAEEDDVVSRWSRAWVEASLTHPLP